MSNLRDARVLNLLFSTTILAVGVAIYWFWPPAFWEPTDHDYLPFVLHGFEFWLIQWVLWIASYGLLQNKSPDVRTILTIIDLNTVLGLGLCLALGMGKDFAGTRPLINLTIIFGLLVGWNFLFSTSALETNASRYIQTLWLLPSMTLSLVSLVGWAFFSWKRYGNIALPFACVSILYAFVQQPSYSLIFLGRDRGEADNQWLTCLAYLKLLLGVTFYSFILR